MRQSKIKLSKKYSNNQDIKNKDKNINIIDNINESLELIKFSKGHLKGVNLYLTKTYYNNVFSQGEYDEQLFDDFQKNTNCKETILDVGGFMGVSSLLFSKIAGSNSKIISFEPNPYNLDRMLLNFSKNPQLSKNISVANIAISNKIGITELLLSSNIDNGYSSTSRLLDTHVEHTQEHLRDIGFFKKEVYQNTIDQYVADTKIIPNIIKVDIEGAEHLFLLGAQKTLKKYSPILYIELHSQYCALKCTEIMDALGYDNTILFEEPDNRILVKYYKDNTKKCLNDTNINELEQKIIKDKIITLENKTNKLNNKNTELENKIILINNEKNDLLNEKEKIKNQKIKLEDEKNKLNSKFLKIEKYLIKLINNPIIKTEIKIFRLFKKIFN